MIELLKNCSNGNEVSTYLAARDIGPKRIVKAAATQVGMDNLRHEIEGWTWYQRMRYPEKKGPICRIVQEKRSFLKIEIAFVEGEKADCRKGLVKNQEMVKKVIEHYCEIWPYTPDGPSPLHGDLSLDNVIYNAEGIHLIDWEHFNENGAPWGFDPLYLLFESLFLKIRNSRRPSSKEISIVADNINFLNNNHKLQSPMIDRPLKYLIDFITGNHTLWGRELSEFQNKFPILAFADDKVAFIDNLVRYKLSGQI